MSVAEVTEIIVAAITTLNFLLLVSSNYKISRVEHQTNSLTNQLVSEVRIASIAKGMLEGKKFKAKK